MARTDIDGRNAPGDDTPRSQTKEGLERFSFNAIHMGGEVRLTFYAGSSGQAEDAARAAFSRYAELEQVMSDYRPSSELMQLCSRAGLEATPVSSDLYKVLDKSMEISLRTGGAFDVSASPVVRLWREARRTGTLPDSKALNIALERVGYEKIVLSELHRTVSLQQKGMQLDLGGIAKGYANDEAIKVFSQFGVESAMVEAGGDISVSGPPPGTQGWAIKVRGHSDAILLANGAISTSGDTEQFVEIGGVRYSHVVDPRTGLGVTSRVQATVIAPVGLTTDPWATALCVNDTLASACRNAGAETIVVRAGKQS